MLEYKLFYNKPASIWEEALPLGNGRLGMMVHGGIDTEVLQLNEQTLWCGCVQDADNPECLEHLEEMRSLIFARRYTEAEELCSKYLVCKGRGSDCAEYGSFQTAGELIITSAQPCDSSDYCRSLDIFTGIARTSCAGFEREHIVSDAFNVTATRLVSDYDVFISFSREECEISYSAGQITARGRNMAPLDFCTVVAVDADGCELAENGLRVPAGECIIYTATATDYSANCDPYEVCCGNIAVARQVGYEEIRRQNAEYMSRAMSHSGGVSLSSSIYDLPTDERLERVRNGEEDNGLLELYFNYGKYLLICSSKGSLPANLQGIWANGMWAPWNGDYHININLQMNYWHADILGLDEYLEPLFDYIEMLARRGENTANVMYGCRGWVAHTITNPWGFTSPGQDPAWGSFMCAGAWCCRHYFEHYLYTGDVEFLRRYYPVMRDCALFFTDFLAEDPVTGYLVTAPSNSPENRFIDPETGKAIAMCAGPAMDNTIVAELFDFTAQAADILGTDSDLAEEWRGLRRRLPPLTIGRYGQIQEWMEDLEESEPGHRHISHLYGLYPAAVITESQTPELYAASRVTLDRRLANGGGHTGWSRAWIINFFARLHDGEAAGFNLHELLAKSTLPNLFDFHPPFQIDGNFGGTAGICEMLIQSHQGFIELLPAVPASWRQGSFEHFRVRGGFIISAGWKDGSVIDCTVRSPLGGKLAIMVNGQLHQYDTQPGDEIKII